MKNNKNKKNKNIQKKKIYDKLKISKLLEYNELKDDGYTWEINLVGEYKDMSTTNKKSGTRNKDEQLFSEGQLRQLATLMKYTIQETVPPMVRSIIQETVPPMIKTAIEETVPPMVRSIIQETVPPMIKTAIEETVPPMIEKIVDEKLKPIKDDLSILKREAIKHGWDLSPEKKN